MFFFTHTRLLQMSLSILCLGISGCGSKPPVKPMVQLAVSASAPSFSQGDPVTLVLDFENISSVNTRISTMTDGNLWIISLDRDGTPVIARETVIRYRDGLKTLLSKNLVTLAPGALTSATWVSAMDPPQSAHSLQVVRFDPEGSYTASLFGVGQPGTYKLTVVYRFGDPWTQPADVFVGETNQATVTFAVSP